MCHGITNQEPRPRQDTLHSGHHSTVLPRLGANRTESIQNLYTHAVDSAIHLLGNNRVLKERTPPIPDEEQRLNRRQQCTLLQLDQSSVPRRFSGPSQFAAAKLTHYSSTMPHRPSDSSRPRQRLLLSGDLHQNPGPATKYPCSVCISNVTRRGVSYMCNRCSGWVHTKCSERSTVELRTGHASLAVPHPLHKYRNRFHHQLQLKLPMGIPSPFCNSTQMN